ncbi:hypothetical protein [Spirillospora sp. CA-294931]|uniref:hypothetical protein n=1 Tax=Spirillospora sp. CA-294931 TaxID=3240042 RepID=UPI003D908541
MRALTASAQVELEERRRHLLRLHWELAQIGVRVSVRKPRSGRWKLKIRGPGRSETVLCAGAEDAYAFVTAHGRILGPVSDARYIARILAWMVEGRRG